MPPDVTVQSIEIEGFLSIRRATVELGKLNVLIGANGAGKSSLLRAFEVLGRLAEHQIEFHVPAIGYAFGSLNGESDRRIRFAVRSTVATYEVVLAPAVGCDVALRLEEVRNGDRLIWSRRGNTGETEPVLAGPLEGCRAFHFHDTGDAASMKRLGPATDDRALHNDGRNVAAVLMNLRDSGNSVRASAYRRIVGSVRLVAPFFEDFVLEPEGNNQVRLRWCQVGSDRVFFARQMSDGMLRTERRTFAGPTGTG